jgi:hypothetical protein
MIILDKIKKQIKEFGKKTNDKIKTLQFQRKRLKFDKKSKL